jgi:hypothetical protein
MKNNLRPGRFIAENSTLKSLTSPIIEESIFFSTLAASNKDGVVGAGRE